MDPTAGHLTPVEDLLATLRTKAPEHAEAFAYGAHCREAILKICKDRTLAAFIEGASFGKVSPVESFRRLDLLRNLNPGTFCSDHTWGFGIVRNVDGFYKKVTIDFDQKQGHQMTYAYAAETLAIIDDNHLLARRHTDPDGLEALTRARPDEIVRMALRTFGSMPVAKLEKTLDDTRIVTQANWKSFWEGARKALKNDPLVDIPTKRNEAITILTQAQDYGDSWMAALGRERDIERILALISELETQAADKIEQAAPVLSNRLAFALKGAYNSDPANYARLAVAVQRLDLDEPAAAPLKAHLWEDNRFMAAAEVLAVREAAELAGYLLQDDPEAQHRIVACLPFLPYTIVGEVLQILYGGPADAEAKALCLTVLQAPDPHPVLLTWAIRNRDAFTNWHLPSAYDLLMKGVSLLDEKRSGEALRMQNTIRLVFENTKSFEAMFAALDALPRQALFERIQASTTWESLPQRLLLNQMIVIDPKLETHRKAAATAPAVQTERKTSWRSLAQRQAAHRHLVEVEIPQNSREIATARSYGDLRENFEYQTAKQQQGLLLLRQAEMNADLRQVKGSDFANAPTDHAGVGTAVTLALPDDVYQTYHILGEWDRDEALDIISYKSKLAQCIAGKKVGDRILIPGETDEIVATIAAVNPLPESVRNWLAEIPPRQTPQNA